MTEENDKAHDSDYSGHQGGSLKPGSGRRTKKVVLTDNLVTVETRSVSTSSDAVAIVLAALGIDTKDMKAAMEKLDEADLQAIRERTLHPEESNVPKPDDFDDEKFVAVASSYAYSVLDGRKQAKNEASKGKDRRISVVTTVIIAVSTLIGGGVIGTYLGKYLSDRAESVPTTEERTIE